MSQITAPAQTTPQPGGSWGERAADWAENEEQQVPTYRAAIDRVGIGPGAAVLEVGCGTGVFLREAADRGARVFGLDAAEPLLALARERVPEADLRVGDLQHLPYADDAFDLVAGFNSFFFAADMTAALREAGRVARPGAPVVIQVWGRAERCDLTPMMRALGPLRPTPPSDGRTPLCTPGVLEGIATEAGLRPEVAFDVSYALDYPDEQTVVRRMLSPGPVVEAIHASGEEAVAAAIAGALAAHRTSSGGYRLENEWHYLVARA